MKNLLILLFVGFSTITINAQTNQSSLEGKVKIEVKGLACPFCAYGLEKKLNQIEGVESIKINIDEGYALLEIKKGKQLSEKAVLEKIKEAGFTPGTMKTENDE